MPADKPSTQRPATRAEMIGRAIVLLILNALGDGAALGVVCWVADLVRPDLPALTAWAALLIVATPVTSSWCVRAAGPDWWTTDVPAPQPRR